MIYNCRKRAVRLIVLSITFFLGLLLFAPKSKIESVGYSLSSTSEYTSLYSGASSGDILSGYFDDEGILLEDINNDTYKDLILCAGGADYGGLNSGSIYVIFGSASVPAGNLSMSTLTNFNIRYDGAAGQYLCGNYSGIFAGDVNGDDSTDLIITSAQSDTNGTNSGSVWILYSTLIDDITGFSNIIALSSLGSFNIRYDGPTGGFLSIRNSVEIADLNTDGYDDLLVSAPSADYGGTDTGSIWVMYSTLLDDVTTTGNIRTLNTTNSSYYNIRYDGTPSDQCGSWRGIQVGDINQNNVNDLVISCAMGSSPDYVFIVDDSLIAAVTGTDQIVSLQTGSNYNARYSVTSLESIKIGDVNGDNYPDLLIGASIDAGNEYIIYSSLLNLITGTDNLLSTSTPAHYNIHIAGNASAIISNFYFVNVHDIDADGFNDLIISAEPNVAVNSDDQGMWILFNSFISAITGTGNSLDLGNITDYNIKIKDGNYDITSVNFGDIDGDSFTDLLLGFERRSYGGSLSGSVKALSYEKLSSYSGTGNFLDFSLSSEYSYRYDGVANNTLGSNHTILGDWDNDGHDDLMFSSPGIVGRVWVLQNGSTISNLDSSLNLVASSDNLTSLKSVENFDIQNAWLKKGADIAAEIDVNFYGPDKNWTAVTADVDTVNFKSVTTGLDGLPGAGLTHKLYVPKVDPSSDGSVVICPDATILSGVSAVCSNAYTLTSADPNVSVITVDGQNYWVIADFESGGGIAFSDNTIPDAPVIINTSNVYGGHTHQDIQVTYSDPDGAVNLDKLYLKIRNDSGDDIEYYAVQGVDAEYQSATAVSGSSYVNLMSYNRDADNPDTSSITVTWRFIVDWDWHEDGVEFGVKAVDDLGADSGWTYTSGGYSFVKSLDFAGTLHVRSLDRSIDLNSGDWVKPGERIRWDGIWVVFEGTTDVCPHHYEYDVHLEDDGGRNWSANRPILCGPQLVVVSTAESNTDMEDIHVFSIISIPTDGYDVSNLSFILRIDSSAPSNVTSLSAQALSTSSIQLTWVNPTEDFDHVKILRKTTGYPTSPTDGIEAYTGNAQILTDTGLNTNTQYYYTVFSYDEFDNYSSGAVVNKTTLASSSPPSTETEQTIVTIPTQPTTETQTGESETDKSFLDAITPDVEIDLPDESNPIEITVGDDPEDTVEYYKGSVDTIHVFKGSKITIRIPESALSQDDKDIDEVYLNNDSDWFRLQKDGDYYVGQILAPNSTGLFTLSVIVLYSDNTIAEMKIGYNVDPFGYVFTKKDGNELRLKDAEITLWIKDNSGERIWQSNSEEYPNPTITDSKGEYGFYVNPGEYKLVTKLDGYETNETEWFTVENKLVEKNIELTAKGGVPWTTLCVSLFAAMILVAIVYLIASFRKRCSIFA